MEKVGLRVNAPQVIHETIDGEVIVINLASGTYYSLRGAGADVWDVIQSSPGADSDAIAAAVGSRFDRPVDTVQAEIASFLEDLRREELISEREVEDRFATPLTASHGAADGSDASRPFEPPVLEKYTDMQDLVLIDPVHEVDATGWPRARPDASAA
jgi:hypothetical protein